MSYPIVRLSLRRCCALLVAVTACSAHAVVLTPEGRFQFSASASTASELGGLSYVSGDQYYAVSDNDSKLYSLHIGINPASGGITSASIDANPLQLNDSGGTAYYAGGTDFEGVAYNPLHNSVFVADEIGPTIHEQSLTGGSQIAYADPTTANELYVYSNIRANAGFESITRQAGGNVLWTANQEPLKTDGPKATINQREPIRIQKLDGSLNPEGQYAYLLDANDTDSGWTTMGSSGVSDLLALPNGQLIALERATGTGGTHGNAEDMRVRLYLIDSSHATDLAGGALGSPVDVTKTLLWENFFDASQNNQFEGITLGPTLANGDASVVMIADNGGGTTHTLFAFDASGVPEPTSVALLALPVGALLRRREKSRARSAAE